MLVKLQIQNNIYLLILCMVEMNGGCQREKVRTTIYHY